MDDLAVIIPAFKPNFLASALASLAAQSDRRFTVYVGDDASPADLQSICREHGGGLNLVYRRFDENLGGKSLAAQWDRCVRLSSEPWVWLFSDDDIADPDCVKAFRAARADLDEVDVYHFDVEVIDGENRTLRMPAPFADSLSSQQFTSERLQYRVSSYAVEYVFSRAVFDRENGFVKFPAAWCSDDASWAAFAEPKGIRTIRGPRIRWRQSGLNISTPTSPYKTEKIRAALMYVEWVNARYPATAASTPRAPALRPMLRSWFYAQLYQLNPRLGWTASIAAARKLSKAAGTAFPRELYRFLRNEARAILRN